MADSPLESRILRVQGLETSVSRLYNLSLVFRRVLVTREFLHEIAFRLGSDIEHPVV